MIDYPAQTITADVEAAFLYCWTDEAELGYAIEGKRGKGRVLNPEFKPAIGFKFGLGVSLPHDNWDLNLKLTHLHSRAKVQTSGKEITPLWSLIGNDPEAYALESSGHWRLHFALIDLTLGHKFLMGRGFSVRPFIGLRYAIIRQKYLIYYEGGTLFPEGDDYMSMKNKFLAPGICGGVDLGWNLRGGFGLYSHFGYSIQEGLVYVHERESRSFDKENGANFYDRFMMAKPIFDLAAGIEWRSPIFKKRYRFLFQIGFEQYIFFGQNQFFHFLTSGKDSFSNNQEQLSIQALSLSTTFSY